MKTKLFIIYFFCSCLSFSFAEDEQKAPSDLWVDSVDTKLERQAAKIEKQAEDKETMQEAIKRLEDKINLLEEQATNEAAERLELEEKIINRPDKFEHHERVAPVIQTLKTTEFTLDTSEKSLKYMARNLKENYIPATAVIPVDLVHGLVVATGDHGLQNPTPVILRIVGAVILPNHIKQLSLTHCNIKGTATGNESTQQIEIRTESLHCVDRVTGEITKTELVGAVISSAGFVGIPAERYDNKNKKALSALLAGTLGGLSSQVSRDSVQPFSPFVAASPLGVGTASANALGQGGGRALDMYAENIIKEMNALSAFLVLKRDKKAMPLAVSVLQGAFLGETEIIKKITEKRNKEINEIVKQFEEETL